MSATVRTVQATGCTCEAYLEGAFRRIKKYTILVYLEENSYSGFGHAFDTVMTITKWIFPSKRFITSLNALKIVSLSP